MSLDDGAIIELLQFVCDCRSSGRLDRTYASSRCHQQSKS